MGVAGLTRLFDTLAGQADPSLQLTSRAALQVRGLPDPLPAQARAGIIATGLVPSLTHELARNIVASPLSGLDSEGVVDIRPLTRALDEGLRADPSLARLPGRFLFVVDDGRGDVIGSAFDVGVIATGDATVTVLAAGASRGWAVPVDAAVPLALKLAREFLLRRAEAASLAWHVRELGLPIGPPGAAAVTLPTGSPPAFGAHGRHAVVGVPLGMLTRPHVAALANLTDEVILTPWRSLVIEDGATGLEPLRRAGLAVTPDSPWARLHACTGLPGCARSAIDTHRLARALAERLPGGHDRLPVHVSGCPRRCGAPSGQYVDLPAPESVSEALALISASTPEDR